MVNKESFFMIKRNKFTEELLKNHNCFVLLTQIAYRAKRTDDFNIHALKTGESLIGDYKNIGLTRQQYRTALANLEKWEFITIKTTSKGTIAKLSDTKVFDINVTTKQPTLQPMSNHQATTNNNYNNINKEIYTSVINFLNAKTNKSFKVSSGKTISNIKARLNEGYVLEDFKKVIEIKTAEWLNDSNMNIYLRPETLFSNKFESYLNQGTKTKPKVVI